ncbi:YfhO family protein [Sinobaca sp. H24]|uniref:YfhO family protein n=1 Tax=Sinobaca sp. H24 TaxID=2923376 RepID=UPI002079B56E|nr:YfhO family protein [Sinobaca sp. H24]
MLGPNDGLNQVAPFKALLYNEYTSGNFFYSFSFGMGAGIYSQLGYYYSTNLVYLFSVAVVFLLDTIGIIDSPDALFWAQANVWISVIRVTVIILITTAVFRYMKIQTVPAFVGASLYAISAIYFRHVVFWEFFADALLWVPLLVLGVEKIIREKQPAWFVVAVALTVFSNFYFAYINLIFIGIYILARWLIRLERMKRRLKSSLKHYTLGGILGFGMGSPGFIPAAYGYFNNHRPPYEDSIPLWDFSDNILFTSLTLLLPTIFLLFVWIGTFYKINCSFCLPLLVYY